MKTEQALEDRIDRLDRAIRKKRKKDRKRQLKKLKRIFKDDHTLGELLLECIDKGTRYFQEVNPTWHSNAARGLRTTLRMGLDHIAARRVFAGLAQKNEKKK